MIGQLNLRPQDIPAYKKGQAELEISRFSEQADELNREEKLSFQALKTNSESVIEELVGLFGEKCEKATNYFEALNRLLHEPGDQYRQIDDAIMVVTNWLDNILTGIDDEYKLAPGGSKVRFGGVASGQDSELEKWLDENIPGAARAITILYTFLYSVIGHRDTEAREHPQSKFYEGIFNSTIGKLLAKKTSDGQDYSNILRNVNADFDLHQNLRP